MRTSRDPQDIAQARALIGKRAKPSKYRNVKTTVDGIVFDSRREAKRWQELKLMQRAGLIGGLERQVRMRLDVNGQRVATYVADFSYTDRGHVVVEDAKGVLTPTYRLKKKLVRALLGVEIREI